MRKTVKQSSALLQGIVTGLVVLSSALAPSLAGRAEAAPVIKGKYYISDNQWGNTDGSHGWVSMWNWGTGQAGTSWGWGQQFSLTGLGYTVKAYPSCVLGWHWGYPTGYPAAPTGLPARLWDNKNVNTGWNFTIDPTTNATQNVSYDLWFHTESNPLYETPSNELMVWLDRRGGAGPLGSYIEDVYLGGTTWMLYRSDDSATSTPNDGTVFSFVRKTNTASSTLNLRDFINYVVYSKGWMSNSKYLTSVQAGSELYVGSGKFQTNSYYCNVE